MDRLDPALELLAEIVRQPAFPADPVHRIRDEQLADILQRAKEPRALASDAAARFIFAADVPYARPILGHRETVGGLGPDELRAFHEARYRAGSRRGRRRSRLAPNRRTARCPSGATS